MLPTTAALLLTLLADAAPTHPVVGSWIIAEGYQGFDLVLVPPGKADEDDWIGLIFQPDGTITWQPHIFYDAYELGGCSNAFGGFSGTWTAKKGRVSVSLSEWTAGGEEYPGKYVVTTVGEDRMTLRYVK